MQRYSFFETTKQNSNFLTNKNYNLSQAKVLSILSIQINPISLTEWHQMKEHSPSICLSKSSRAIALFFTALRSL